jgi:hypothetical protein
MKLGQIDRCSMLRCSGAGGYPISMPQTPPHNKYTHLNLSLFVELNQQFLELNYFTTDSTSSDSPRRGLKTNR